MSGTRRKKVHGGSGQQQQHPERKVKGRGMETRKGKEKGMGRAVTNSGLELKSDRKGGGQMRGCSKLRRGRKEGRSGRGWGARWTMEREPQGRHAVQQHRYVEPS